tara:strand:+ start:170638 stop:170892 length:255 start_codon:yes stop_codon:yes gene_type:complete
MSRAKNTEEQIKLAKLFSKRLKLERENMGLSQNELAMRTNISIDTIRSLEGCRIKTPGLFMAYKLVLALDGKIEEWLNEIDEQL